mgnify:CR=1 FL=1
MAAGLTQIELAERASTTQATIARIERGDNVSFAKYAQIAHALGKRVKVSFEWPYHLVTTQAGFPKLYPSLFTENIQWVHLTS